MSKGKMIAIGVLVVVAGIILYLMFSESSSADELKDGTGDNNNVKEPPVRITPVQVSEWANSGVKYNGRTGEKITTFDVVSEGGSKVVTYVLKPDESGYEIKK